MTICAATLLGPNTVPILESVILQLAAGGHDIEMVSAPALSGLGVEAVEAVAELDLVWACGLLTAQLIDAGCPIDVVAAPIFNGETRPVYRSVVIARSGAVDAQAAVSLADLVQLRVAVNETGSWSGYQALIRDFTAVRGESLVAITDAIRADMVLTGAHVESVRAVQSGRADLASIDHSIWDWLLATDPTAAAGLVVVDQTAEWPAPPFSINTRCTNNTALTVNLLAMTEESPAGLAELRPASVSDYHFMTAMDFRPQE